MKSRKVVLIVDDDIDAREVNAVCLRTGSYIAMEASNGRDALAKMRTVKPDAVITDMRMPLMDGLKLAMEMKADEALRRVPLGLLTGSPPHDAVEINYFDEILLKPCSLDALLDLASRLTR